MAKQESGLRKLVEWLGHIHLAEWLLTLLLAGLNAAGVAYWAWWTWATQWGYLPIYLAALLAFAVSLWAVNGILWLVRQRRPSRARIAFDYEHSLALTDVLPSLDLHNKDNTLEIRIRLQNVATGPAKILVEKLEVTVEDRYVRIGGDAFKNVIPRASSTTIMVNKGFSQEAYRKFKDRTSGTLEYSIIYGHPADAYSRRATKTLHLDLFKRTDNGKEWVAVNWIVRSETDEAVNIS